MNKNLVLLFLFFISVSVHAQIKLAIKGGPNFSTAKIIHIDEVTSAGTKQPSGSLTGYGLGLMLDVPFDGKLHFMPSLSFNSRGFWFHPTYSDTSKVETSIKYIDINPSFSVNFNTGKKNSFAIFAGPELSFALSGKEKNTQAGITTSKSITISNTNDYGTFDLGISTGIQYRTKKFIFEAAYQLGLANINNNIDIKQTPPVSNYKLDIKNRMLSLNIGYFIK